MPLVQKTLTLAAGATSDNILADTNYEFVDGNVRLRVASAVDTAGTSATSDTFLNVSVNNAEYSKDDICTRISNRSTFWSIKRSIS